MLSGCTSYDSVIDPRGKQQTTFQIVRTQEGATSITANLSGRDPWFVEPKIDAEITSTSAKVSIGRNAQPAISGWQSITGIIVGWLTKNIFFGKVK